MLTHGAIWLELKCKICSYMKNPPNVAAQTRGMSHSFWYIYIFGQLNQMPHDQIHLTIKKRQNASFGGRLRSSSAFVYFATWLISDSIRKHISSNCCRNDTNAHVPSHSSCYWFENIRLPVKIRRLQAARVARDKSDVKVSFDLTEIH